MQLYLWNSDFFTNWEAGVIIVMAESVESARERAIAKWEDDFGKELRKYADDDYNMEKVETFLSDINKEPSVIEDGVVFMYGSA